MMRLRRMALPAPAIEGRFFGPVGDLAAGRPLLVVELMQVTQCRGGGQQGCNLVGREFVDQPGERLRPGQSADRR